MNWWVIAGWILVAVHILSAVLAPIGVGKERQPRTELEAAMSIIFSGLIVWWLLLALQKAA